MIRLGFSRLSQAGLSVEAKLNLLALVGVFGGGMLFLYTRRVELLALIALPMALGMVSSFRTSALVTTCVMLLWLSRVPMVFFDLAIFSYAVYACVAITAAAYLLRLLHHGNAPLPIVSNRWLALYVAVVLIGGVKGIVNVEAIPAWILTGTIADYGVPWVYFRNIILPGLLLPLLAIMTAAAIADRQKLSMTILPAVAFATTMALMVLVSVATSSLTLGGMADSSYRDQHLSQIGFHSNELGTLLAIAYALILGSRAGLRDRRARVLTACTLLLIGTAQLLTFSRGAMLAFLVVNGLFFITGSRQKRALFVALAMIGWLIAPAALFERAQFGLDTMDLNQISAGRLENIWLPLMPDIADHLFFGQGLHSVMWTDAQRLQQIYPVSLSHNAYLDLVLDLGLVGGACVLGWYIFLWRLFSKGAAKDPDARFRGVFHGGQLALVGLFVCALSNDRLTPTAPTCLLWLAAGVALGRELQLRHPVARVTEIVRQRSAVTALPNRPVRPLVVTRARGEA